MSAKDALRRNKTHIQMVLCGDHRLILNKVQERNLITPREYNNLKIIRGEDVEGHVVELVDKIMNKGEDTCKAFLVLLETDEEIRTTFPELETIRLRDTCLPPPVQASSNDCGKFTDILCLPAQSENISLCLCLFQVIWCQSPRGRRR